MRTQLVDGLLADLLQVVRFLRAYRSPVISQIRRNISHNGDQKVHDSFLLFAAEHDVQEGRQNVREHHEGLGAMLARVTTADRFVRGLRFRVAGERVAVGLGRGFFAGRFR